MSIDNVKMFFKKIGEDQELLDKVKGLHDEHQENLRASLVKLGADAGYPFDTEDLERFRQEIMADTGLNEELDDAQLEAVAGGSEELWIFISVTTLGIVCAFSALGRAVEGFRCIMDAE